jgi:hypothetical protein
MTSKRLGLKKTVRALHGQPWCGSGMKRLTALRRAFLCAVLLSTAPNYGHAADANQFSYSVPFELGDIEFATGDRISITELRGTAPAITVGETYEVQGTYTLASREQATLAFYSTTSNNSGPVPVDARQRVQVEKGSGTFRLSKTLRDDGYLHLSFYNGSSFGGVYFGEGQGVLRQKPWSAGQPAGHSQNAAVGRVSFADANQAIATYLGEPVEAPANLDPRYNVEGLSNAVRLAADATGESVRIEIDDSEFPFLIGVSSSQSAFSKLMQQIKKMAGYADQGSVGSHDCHAFNIVPYPAFPAAAAERIGHRLTVREQMFYDRLSRSAGAH